MHIVGGISYDPIGQASATSSGPNDVQTVSPPTGTDAMALSLESPAIRITFDGKKPGPHHGLKLVGPDHFFAIGKRLKFASAEAGRPAIVNFLWLKARARPRDQAGS
jgi:hypothetical protein